MWPSGQSRHVLSHWRKDQSMTLRRSLPVTAALATLVAPLAAFAQFAGSVTTDPVGQPAPTLGMPLIFLLAVALAGVAGYSLRRGVATPVVALVLVAGVTVLAGLGYAGAPT